MPQFPLLPRYDVAVNYVVSGQFCTNVLHYEGTLNAPSLADIRDAASALSVHFGNPYKAFLGPASSFEGIELRYVSAGVGRYVASATGSGAGTFPSGSGATPAARQLPSGDAAVIRKFGDGPPKRANGTAYISGLLDEHVSDGRLTVEVRELLTDIGIAFAAPLPIGPAAVMPTVLSRTAGNMFSLSYCEVQQVPGHLTRRRPFR
jgi:hypothetical protein